jgi:hypothetical protein
MTDTEQKAFAFAELMRKLSLGVIQELIANNPERAKEKALVLHREAIDHKREFGGKGLEEPEEYDLSGLRVDLEGKHPEIEERGE